MKKKKKHAWCIRFELQLDAIISDWHIQQEVYTKYNGETQVQFYNSQVPMFTRLWGKSIKN